MITKYISHYSKRFFGRYFKVFWEDFVPIIASFYCLDSVCIVWEDWQWRLCQVVKMKKMEWGSSALGDSEEGISEEENKISWGLWRLDESMHAKSILRYTDWLRRKAPVISPISSVIKTYIGERGRGPFIGWQGSGIKTGPWWLYFVTSILWNYVFSVPTHPYLTYLDSAYQTHSYASVSLYI